MPTELAASPLPSAASNMFLVVQSTLVALLTSVDNAVKLVQFMPLNPLIEIHLLRLECMNFFVIETNQVAHVIVV